MDKKAKLKPEWLKKKIFYSKENLETAKWIQNENIHTVCEEARCPNRSECYHSHTATFLILGDICTRSCQFCSVATAAKSEWNQLSQADSNEIEKIVSLSQKMKLEYVVITSVDRDDLADKGSGHFADVMKALKESNPKLLIEVLTPDFDADSNLIKKVLDEKPDVFNHNIETVERISPRIRRMSSYTKSLKVLEEAKKIDKTMITKSGIMLGFGEQKKEVLQTIDELSSIQCDILTIGQYLQPTKKNIAVQEYIPEDQFVIYKDYALNKGIKVVEAGPFVRSSYRAVESYYHIKNGIKNGK